jgi:hypothetical protein
MEAVTPTWASPVPNQEDFSENLPQRFVPLEESSEDVVHIKLINLLQRVSLREIVSEL